jgi:hypothetical protein
MIAENTSLTLLLNMESLCCQCFEFWKYELFYNIIFIAGDIS